MADTGFGSYEIPLIFAFSEILVSSDNTDHIKELQLSALGQLRSYLRHYQSLGYMDRLIYTIAEKKCKLLLEITTKADMEKLIKPRCPQFDGNKFVTDELMIPEEELIGWSQASLSAPLNGAAFKRYMELFKQVLPQEYAEMQHIQGGTDCE